MMSPHMGEAHRPHPPPHTWIHLNLKIELLWHVWTQKQPLDTIHTHTHFHNCIKLYQSCNFKGSKVKTWEGERSKVKKKRSKVKTSVCYHLVSHHLQSRPGTQELSLFLSRLKSNRGWEPKADPGSGLDTDPALLHLYANLGGRGGGEASDVIACMMPVMHDVNRTRPLVTDLVLLSTDRVKNP